MVTQRTSMVVLMLLLQEEHLEIMLPLCRSQSRARTRARARVVRGAAVAPGAVHPTTDPIAPCRVGAGVGDVVPDGVVHKRRLGAAAWVIVAAGARSVRHGGGG